VLPIDNSTLARWNTPRPSLTAGRTMFTYSGELTGYRQRRPSILNKAYTITAEVDDPRGWRGRYDRHRRRSLRRLRPVPEAKANSAIGRGQVVFLYNLLDLKRTMWEGPELSAGKHNHRL
jgi:arylsulfatase